MLKTHSKRKKWNEVPPDQTAERGSCVRLRVSVCLIRVQIRKAVINQYTGNSNKPPSSRHWLTCCSPFAETLRCCAQSDQTYFISECTQHAISWWQADQAKKWLFISLALQCFQICSRATRSCQTLMRLMCLFHFLYIYRYSAESVFT